MKNISLEKKECELLYNFLRYALIEIREEAYNSKNKKIFALSDLLHNLPSELKMAVEGNKTYLEILNKIERHAEKGGLEKWVDNIKEHTDF